MVTGDLMGGLNVAQLRDHLGTFGHGDRATWVEGTPQRRHTPASVSKWVVRLRTSSSIQASNV